MASPQILQKYLYQRQQHNKIVRQQTHSRGTRPALTLYFSHQTIQTVSEELGVMELTVMDRLFKISRKIRTSMSQATM